MLTLSILTTQTVQAEDVCDTFPEHLREGCKNTGACVVNTEYQVQLKGKLVALKRLVDASQIENQSIKNELENTQEEFTNLLEINDKYSEIVEEIGADYTIYKWRQNINAGASFLLGIAVAERKSNGKTEDYLLWAAAGTGVGFTAAHFKFNVGDLYFWLKTSK